jgi:CBS domain-containing protein
MKIEALIKEKQVRAIKANDTVEYLLECLNSFNVGALVVSEDGKVIDGIVSERDVVRSLSGKSKKIGDLHVRDIMTVEVFTCKPEATVAEIMSMMTAKRIRHIPVVDEKGDLLSIVSIGDVVKHHLIEISLENQTLKEYVSTAR